MTRGAVPLTLSQKQIIRENMERMMPTAITKLEGIEGTTRRQVIDYIRKLPEMVDAEMVVWVLETWIEKDGLKAEYSVLIRYIRDLKKRG